MSSLIKSANLKCSFICLIVTGVFFCSYLTASAELSVKDRLVKIGCLFPLIGPNALYGEDSLAATKIAQDDIKKYWPASSFIFEVAVGDTRSKTLRSIHIARNFINNKDVDFLCGVVSSNVALSVTAIARKNNVFFIGTDHASPRLVSDTAHSYYFRVSNDSRQSMQAGAKYISHYYKQVEKLRIAFIGPDSDISRQSWSDLRAFLNNEAVSFDVVGEFFPQLSEKDYSIYINALIYSKPDIVINGQWGQSFTQFILQAKPADLFDQMTLMNFDAGGNYDVLSMLGQDMPLGLVLSARHHVNWPTTDRNADFVETFKKEVGRYPSHAAQGAYSGIMAIAKVVHLAGGISDKEKLRQNFKSLVINLPEDPEGFVSRMDADSHQLLQAQAIGVTVNNNNYPPAKVMLGNWFVHYPTSQWPTLKATPTSTETSNQDL